MKDDKDIKETRPDTRAGTIKSAAIVALVGNALLAALKIGVGLYAGSFAVVGDGIDSLVDIFIALMSLVVARIIAQPADQDHPWGHGRAETVATALLSFTLFFAGAQLILSAGKALLSAEAHEVPRYPALIVSGISLLAKLALAWNQHLLGKKAHSAMLKANAKNMSADAVLSGAVLAGLGLSTLFNTGAIDFLAALLVGCWILTSAVSIFIAANTELMDGGSGAESYQLVFEAVHSVPGAGHPHRVHMRRLAGLWDIDIDIEVHPNMTVIESHWIAYQVESAIKKRIEGVYDIVVHIEPEGNLEAEGFGLNEKEEGGGGQ
jgi:cation diffusion facilitator family transporter